ncbi:uncharacterized protein LOC124180827 [Neodiprion fabricii]|uniref:uncharacterized protein LOC124180827 n=1 Tax=Neodiprion fabricii TaxID=2872261 RepID=UPI001ED8C4CF|nr:uncharacterized protein LOC124180827 [Neodiprion fabricii]
MKIGLTITICFTIIAGLRAEDPCDKDEKLWHHRCPADKDNNDISMSENCNEFDPVSVRVSSCVSVTISETGIGLENEVESLTVENVTKELQLSTIFSVQNMRLIKLLNIGNIPNITHSSFTSVNRIGQLRIENTKIEFFEETLKKININEFILINVTIEKLHALEIFDVEGLNVTFINCRITVNGGPVQLENSKHGSIKLVNTMFEFENSGNMSLKAEYVQVLNCTFIRASVNVISDYIDVNDTCGDNASSMTLRYTKHLEYNRNEILIEKMHQPEKAKEGNQVPEKNNNSVVDEAKVAKGAAAGISCSLSLCLVAVSYILTIRM